MKKKLRALLLVSLTMICTTSAFGITPTGQYNSGKRAFLLGHWQESSEIFTRFLKTWPSHILSTKANYFKAVAEIRSSKSLNDIEHQNKIAELEKILANTKEKLPEFDTSDLEVYIQSEKNTHWTEDVLSSLPEQKLMHILARRWYPEPQKFPIKTLEWITRWKKSHKRSINPKLDAKISYIKALALWEFLLSPLSKDANMVILKTWGCWPVHTAFEEALDNGFSKGSPSLKRDVALLGYHYEYFLHNSFLQNKRCVKNNHWYSYLKTRGISDKEAWCPR